LFVVEVDSFLEILSSVNDLAGIKCASLEVLEEEEEEYTFD